MSPSTIGEAAAETLNGCAARQSTLPLLDVTGDQAFLCEENNLTLTLNVRHDRAGMSHLITFSTPYHRAG